MPAEACKPSNTKEKRNTLSKMNHQQALKRFRLYLYKMQARDPQIQQCVPWGPRGLSNKDIKEAGQWQRKKRGSATMSPVHWLSMSLALV